MRLFMTDGMFGRCLELIGPEFKTIDECMKELQSWKNSPLNKKFYRIEPYDRTIFKPKSYEIAIDFGDYFTFMLITGAKCEDEQDIGVTQDIND